MSDLTPETTVYPTINLNGTDGDTLLQNLYEVAHSIENAIDTLLRHAPHGRDYQIGPMSYSQALAQFNERLEALRAVKESVLAETKEVQRQRDEQQKRRDAQKQRVAHTSRLAALANVYPSLTVHELENLDKMAQEVANG